MSKTVLVQMEVRPEAIPAFLEHTLENVRCSRREPGIIRFDLLQSQEDPCRFVLVETYRDDDAPAAHKATAHYAAWREAVEPMMAVPLRSCGNARPAAS